MFRKLIQPILNELVHCNIYKGSQGRITRRSTFLGIVVLFLAGAYNLYSSQLISNNATLLWSLVAFICVSGFWIGFRAVNFPPFAEFLVSVEAEMVKVTWPGKKELVSTSVVCLLFMAIFTGFIFIYDMIFTLMLSGVNYMFGS